MTALIATNLNLIVLAAFVGVFWFTFLRPSEEQRMLQEKRELIKKRNQKIDTYFHIIYIYFDDREIAYTLPSVLRKMDKDIIDVSEAECILFSVDYAESVLGKKSLRMIDLVYRDRKRTMKLSEDRLTG